MKKILMTILLLWTVGLYCGCGQIRTESSISDGAGGSEAIEASTEGEEGREKTEEILQEDESKEGENTSEEVENQAPLDAPYNFLFRDVFGKEYETEIKVGFPKTDLVKEGFSFDGQFISYEDENYYTRKGIDVSNKQKYINWDKVKAAGVEFAIIRLGYRGYGSYGDINIDLQFHNNIKKAQELGIDVGVYFFAQAVNEEEALEEAEFVLKNLEGYELQLPVVYDPESILNDVARTDNVSGEQFTQNTIAFCERIKEAGYEPMIYSNMLWEAFQFDMEQLTDYPFWYADYEQYPQTPYAFTMWQYTEKGMLDGIYTKVDLDIQFIKKEK